MVRVPRVLHASGTMIAVSFRCKSVVQYYVVIGGVVFGFSSTLSQALKPWPHTVHFGLRQSTNCTGITRELHILGKGGSEVASSNRTAGSSLGWSQAISKSLFALDLSGQQCTWRILPV